MPDSDVEITAGTGTKVDTRTVGAGSDEHRQVVVVGDPATAANVQTVDADGRAAVRTSAEGEAWTDIVANAMQMGVADEATGIMVPARADANGTLYVRPNSGVFAVQGRDANGAAAVGNPALVAGSDGSAVRTLKTASDGTLKVDGSAATQPVSGTFWQATQPVSGPLTDTELRASAVPVSISALPNEGQQTMANSISVAVASNQSAVPVDGSGVTQPVSGTFWQATQPVSAAALPLPTGAATEAKQPALGTAGSASADVITVQGIASMTAIKTAEDWRLNATAERYCWSGAVTPPATTAGGNLLGLRKTSANPDVFIQRIRITIHHAAAAVSFRIGLKRATTVGGGSQVTAADIPKLDTAAGNATLEVRTGAVTFGAEAAQYLLICPGGTVAAPAANTGAGIDWEWVARDLAGRLRLTGDEGLIFENIDTTDTDARVNFTIEWEEAS